MANTSTIRKDKEVIGADDVHVGTVDRLEGDRIKLAKKTADKAPTKGIITTSQQPS